MKKIITVLSVALITLALSSCATSGAYTQSGHKACAAYGNPWF